MLLLFVFLFTDAFVFLCIFLFISFHVPQKNHINICIYIYCVFVSQLFGPNIQNVFFFANCMNHESE